MAAATRAWKILKAESVSNAYILKGGINNWIRVFGGGESDLTALTTPVAIDQLAYDFPAALGARFEAADPNPLEWMLPFTPKIQLERKRSPSGGGCG